MRWKGTFKTLIIKFCEIYTRDFIPISQDESFPNPLLLVIRWWVFIRKWISLTLQTPFMFIANLANCNEILLIKANLPSNDSRECESESFCFIDSDFESDSTAHSFIYIVVCLCNTMNWNFTPEVSWWANKRQFSLFFINTETFFYPHQNTSILWRRLLYGEDKSHRSNVEFTEREGYVEDGE